MGDDDQRSCDRGVVWGTSASHSSIYHQAALVGLHVPDDKLPSLGSHSAVELSRIRAVNIVEGH